MHRLLRTAAPSSTELRITSSIRPTQMNSTDQVTMVADQLLDQNTMAADELRDQITLAPEKLPVPNPALSACSTNNCLRGLAQGYMVLASWLSSVWVWRTCVIDMPRRPIIIDGEDAVGAGAALVAGRRRGRGWSGGGPTGQGRGQADPRGFNGDDAFASDPEDDYVILIPLSHIFALMLRALKLPSATYQHKPYPGNESCVTVTFNSSLQLIDGLLVPTSISGVISKNCDEADDSAAMAAIKFMEDVCGKEVRDYHYIHVKRLESKVTHLIRLLVAANKTIKKARRGWYYAARYMNSYSNQIQNTTVTRYLRGHDSTKWAMKTALASTGKLAKRLRYIGMKSEQRLETTVW
ncbi:hypothetical protein TRIUR3_20375 [Triticum urartu]|uniref:Uncharacterized protein n=1 Tax=Triticum urartu TaxID=4572 RepID=M7ZNY4_TRIUA|nr:hypothetical protein TRIUR3_20375 [Triticum urartu]